MTVWIFSPITNLEIKSILVFGMEKTRKVEDLVLAAGGPDKIAAAADHRGIKLTKWAVYKWPQNGIPQKHWALISDLANADPAEIYQANNLVKRVA